MADKEVTLYLVDVGISMAERRHGRQETDLDWAMRYVWDRITSTVRSSEAVNLTIVPDRLTQNDRWRLDGRCGRWACWEYGRMVYGPLPPLEGRFPAIG